MSQPSLPVNQYSVPTLRAKKDGERNVLRRKSDKRRRSDQVREQEIRNMVESQASAAGPQALRGDTGSNVAGGAPAQRSSSEAPDSRALKVSVFDALIPRPVLRYKEKSRAALQPTREVSRSSASKGKRPAVKETHIAEDDRIDELADDMDARGLRQLLERDRRRSMRSHGAQELLEQKLQKHQADRERQPSPILPPLPKPTWPLPASNASESWLENPSKEHFAKPEPASQTTGDQQRRDDITAVATAWRDKPAVDNRASVAGASHLAPSTDQSMSDLSRTVKSEKRNSGLQLTRSALGGIFRRTSSRFKRRPDANEQSTSSVQSRESFAKIQPSQPRDIEQAPAVPPKSILRNPAAAASSHGTSKFTEHLNDFPMPPTTATASGALSGGPSAVDSTSGPGHRNSMGTGVGTIDRYSVSAISTADAGDERATGGDSPEPRPDSMLLAQSLASIDSEASWISGKPSRRLSEARKNQLLKTPCSASERLEESAAESGEGEDNTTGDEIFGRMSLADEEGTQDDKPEESNMSSHTERHDGGTASEVTPRDQEEPGTLHASIGRRPRVISPAARQQSAEGLFTNYQESAPESHSSAEVRESPADDDSEVHRATSIDFGRGHARQISAGSAKLLDLSSSSRRPSQAKSVDSAEAKPDPE